MDFSCIVFNLFTPQIHKKFMKAYDYALAQNEPHSCIESSLQAISLAQQIKPWPFPDHPREKAIGIMYGLQGRLYTVLAETNPGKYAELACTACNKALEYLTPAHGENYIIALNNKGIAYADRINGSIGENVEIAIQCLEEVIKHTQTDHFIQDRVRAFGNLGSFYCERQHGEKAQNIETALQYIQSMIDLLHSHPNPPLLASGYLQLGQVYKQRELGSALDNIVLTIESIEKGLEIGEQYVPPEQRAVALIELMTAYGKRFKGNHQKNVQKVLQIRADLDQSLSPTRMPRIWAMYKVRSAQHFAESTVGNISENHKKAEALIEEALTVYTESDFPQEHEHALRTLKQIITNPFNEDYKINLQEAITSARQDLAKVDKSTEHYSWLQSALHLADLLIGHGVSDRADATEEAITLYKSILDSITADSDRSNWLHAMANLSNCYATRNNENPVENLEKSIFLLEQVLERIDLSADPRRWLNAITNLADSYENRLFGSVADNIEKAISLIEEAMVVANGIHYPLIRINLLRAHSRCFLRRPRGSKQKNVEEAISSLSLAKILAEEISNERCLEELRRETMQAQAQLSDNLSDADKSTKTAETVKPEAFFEPLEKAVAAIDPEKEFSAWAEAQLDLTSWYMRGPRTEEDGIFEMMEGMVSNCNRVVDICNSIMSKITQRDYPNLYMRVLDKIARANELMSLCMNAHRFVSNDLERDQKNASEIQSEEAKKESAKSLGQLLEVQSAEYMPRVHLPNAVRKGKMEFELKNWNLALEAFKSASKAANALLLDVEVNQQELKDVLGNLSDLASLAPIAALKCNDLRSAITLSENAKARLLAKRLSLNALPLKIETRNTLNALKEEIETLEEKLCNETFFDRATPTNKLIDIRAKVREIVFSSDFKSEESQQDIVHSVTQLLDDATTLVLPFFSDSGGYLVFLYKLDGSVKAKFTTIDVESKLFSRYRFGDTEAMIDSWSSAYYAYSNKSASPMFKERKWQETLNYYRVLTGESFTAKLVRVLKAEGIKKGTKLRILPHGFLGHLPISMGNCENDLRLIDEFPIAISPSLRVIEHARQSQVQQTDSLFCLSPSFEQPEKRLLYSEFEVSLAKSWFGLGSNVKPRLRNPSRTELLEELLGKSIWHFCTHATFNEKEPLASMIDLGNGQTLTVKEIIKALPNSDPRLVILSACESALYGLADMQNEFVGLPGAFLQAGAKGVIATLWPIDDRASALLIGRFYELHFGEELEVANALRLAQIWLRDATLTDIIDKVEQWKTKRRLNENEANTMLEPLRKYQQHQKQNCTPFSAESFWAGFVYYGI